MPMPFTNKPSNRAELPTQSERAISAVIADVGSADQRAHADPALKHPCPRAACAALINMRCIQSRRPRTYAPTSHPERQALAEKESVMTTTATTPKPATTRTKKTGNPKTDKPVNVKNAATSPKPATPQTPAPPAEPRLTNEHKQLLSARVIRAFADVASDLPPELPANVRQLARQWCSDQASYMPKSSDLWDDRLPAPRPFKSSK